MKFVDGLKVALACTGGAGVGGYGLDSVLFNFRDGDKINIVGYGKSEIMAVFQYVTATPHGLNGDKFLVEAAALRSTFDLGDSPQVIPYGDTLILTDGTITHTLTRKDASFPDYTTALKGGKGTSIASALLALEQLTHIMSMVALIDGDFIGVQSLGPEKPVRFAIDDALTLYVSPWQK